MIGMTMFKSKTRRRSFAKNRSGSAAVEFAIVVPVFLATMFSIFEVGWFYYVGSIVDASVNDGARMLRTGQIQKSGGTPDDKFDILYNDICNVLDTFGDCQTRLTVESKVYATFADLAIDNSPPTCADAPPADLDAIPFEPGDELQIVRVRICYIYTTVNPAIGINLSEPSTNKRRLISTMIFRNEPYEKNTS